jgi:rSAM/selenodomain-associated transferase 2
MGCAVTAELSVIIPTLDAAATIGATLDALTGEATPTPEIVIADGGSRDATINIAAGQGANFVAAPPGRGRQLRDGAEAATGRWYLFLHADTVLERGWSEEIGRFMNHPDNAERAAYLRFALDDNARAARRLEAVVAWRSRVLGLPYGDQGLLISAGFYDALGGFKPLLLMEDVDMVRRIGRRRLVMLDVEALTSASRFQHSGYMRRSARNLSCVALYFIGVPIPLIARVYGG